MIGAYSTQEDYQEHWCDLEDNEKPGWFPGMHLDNCVFPALTADEVCPAYDMMDLEQALRPWGRMNYEGQDMAQF